jgi:hypothetical protein
VSGINPFGAQPRPARLPEFGVGYSGFALDVKPGKREQVLNVSLKEVIPNGYAGLAVLHVSVEDVTILPAGEQSANAMLLGYVDWQSGRAEGQEVVDLTRGGMIPVGGTSHVGLFVELVSSVEGEPVVAYATKRVTVAVNWFGHTHKPPKVTTPTIALTATFASAFVRIPPQASSMVAYSPEPLLLPGLVAEFSTDQTTGGIRYRAINPTNANPADIVHGVEFVRFVSPANMEVFPSFSLW